MLAALGSACTGVIDADGDEGTGRPSTGGEEMGQAASGAGKPGRGDGAGGSGPAPGPSPGVKPAPGAPAAFAPAPGVLRLLTAAQLRNSVRDLLGSVTIPELEADTAHSGFASVGASLIAVSPIGVERYEAVARDVARQAFADPARRAALVPCAPKSATDEACARTFLGGFLRRAWRRPVPPADVDRYVAMAMKVAAAEADLHAGLRAAVAAALQSPFFLYRIEVGEEPGAGGGKRFSGYEMASRLSYLLWNSTPDDELLAAAPSLTDAEGVRRQAMRLLASPRARDGLVNFIAELFAVEHLGTVAKDGKVLPITPSLREAMATELRLLFADHAIEKNGDLMDLFTTRSTFVNAELARHYGLPAVTGTAWKPVTLPADGPRAGLLGTGAFLTMWGKQHETSPTLRGKFIRTALLCGTVPSPPPEVATVLPEPPAGVTLSRRDLLKKHVEDPSCGGCHDLVDPLGFGLEAFDGIGRFRRTEHGLPIDPSGNLDGAPFADARQMGERLRQHAGAKACLVRSFYRYATGHVETAGEEPLVERLVAGWEGGGRTLRALVLDLVTSEGFRLAAAGR